MEQSGLFKRYELDRYQERWLFHENYNGAFPLREYIKAYVALPIDQLMAIRLDERYGLLERVDTSITFFAQNELSLCKTVVDRYEPYVNDIILTEPDSPLIYGLRFQLHYIYEYHFISKVKRYANKDLEFVTKLSGRFIQLFILLDEALGKVYKEGEQLLSNFQMVDFLSPSCTCDVSDVSHPATLHCDVCQANFCDAQIVRHTGHGTLKPAENPIYTIYKERITDPDITEERRTTTKSELVEWQSHDQNHVLKEYLDTHLENMDESIAYDMINVFNFIKEKQNDTIKRHYTSLFYPLILSLLVKKSRTEPEHADRIMKLVLQSFHSPVMDTKPKEDTLVYPVVTWDLFLLYNKELPDKEFTQWYDQLVPASTRPLKELRDWVYVVVQNIKRGVTVESLQLEYDDRREEESHRIERGRLPLLVNGQIGTRPVFIYGEEHGHIDNTFYQDHHFDTRTDGLFWVEHSTMFCQLKPGDLEIKRIRYARGAEWVWRERTLHSRPVTCIDTRLEHGLPDGYMENALKSVAGIPDAAMRTAVEQAVMTRYEEEFEDPAVLLRYMTKWLRSISQLPSIRHPRINPLVREFVDVIRVQSTSILTTIREERQLVPITVNGKETTTFHQDVFALVTNLLHLFSLTVDAHILYLLEQHRAGAEPIHIFVGMNHAFRLAMLMDWPIVDNTTFNMRKYRAIAMKTMKPIVNDWNAPDRIAEDASAFLEFASKGKKKQSRKRYDKKRLNRHKSCKNFTKRRTKSM